VYYVGKDCFNDEPILQGQQVLNLILILRSVLLVEETGVPGENYQRAAI
jgi:hypothetical protein